MSPGVLLIAVVTLERVVAELTRVYFSVLGFVLGPRTLFTVVLVKDAMEPDRTVAAGNVQNHFAVLFGRRFARPRYGDGDLVRGVGVL